MSEELKQPERLNSIQLDDATPRKLIGALNSLGRNWLDVPINAHSCGHGIEIRIMESSISLVGYTTGRPVTDEPGES